MHSNSLGCPEIFPLSAPVLYRLSHLTCISILKLEKRAENVDLHTAKKYLDRTNIFSRFLDELLSIDLRPIYCSLTCSVGAVATSRSSYLSLALATGLSVFLSFLCLEMTPCD